MILCSAPISLADANRYVVEVHRHNGALPAAKFSVAAVDSATGEVHGVAIAGVPKARMLADGFTLEVNRVCTDGTRNCCSFLYGCCKRAAAALGYSRIVTYTHKHEGGASLRASGWACEGEAGGGSWHRENFPDRNKIAERHSTASKVRWSIALAKSSPPAPIWPWPEQPDHPSLFTDIDDLDAA